MEQKNFIIEEYRTLREEIRETKSRIYRTIVAGLTVVPAANALGEKYDITVLLVSLPILVLVVAFLYLSEFHGLMRCGRYIRENIEPHVDKVVGWENWLSTPDETKKRTVDLFAFVSFNILYAVYFVGGAVLAVNQLRVLFGSIAMVASGLVYLAILVWSAVFMLRHWRQLTTTAKVSSDT